MLSFGKIQIENNETVPYCKSYTIIKISQILTAHIFHDYLIGLPGKGTYCSYYYFPGWIAMDLGNIVLHLFTQHMRELYDLGKLRINLSNYLLLHEKYDLGFDVNL